MKRDGWSLPSAPDLSKSCSSLSATASASSSSVSNLSRCGSTRSLSICSLHNSGAKIFILCFTISCRVFCKKRNITVSFFVLVESIQSDGSRQAKVEMIVAALRARKEALEIKLAEKKDELQKICLREGELTGSLPPEYPLGPGEELPQVRRRVGTSFSFPSDLLFKLKSNPIVSSDVETFRWLLIASVDYVIDDFYLQQDALELDFEIQKRIASAALKLANDMNAKKSVRKQRRQAYQMAKLKLQDLEVKLRCIKDGKSLESNASTATLPAAFGTTKKKKPRPLLLGGNC